MRLVLQGFIYEQSAFLKFAMDFIYNISIGNQFAGCSTVIMLMYARAFKNIKELAQSGQINFIRG